MSIHRITDPEIKTNICDKILHALPEWFGIESSIAGYIKDTAEMDFWVAREENQVVGFIALKKHNEYTAEIYVMGILKEFHRRGLGEKLIRACEEFCASERVEFLTVKTLDASRKSESYTKTRLFYHSMGFRPLEVFPDLWDKDNPCLFMAKRL